MPRKLSRRALSQHIATRLIAGDAREILLNQLAAYLIQTRRTHEAPLISRDIQYYLAENGQVAGSVVSAFELSAATRKALEAFTKQATNASSVQLESIIDPSVIGGVKLSLPGKELDATVSRKLTLLKTRYKKA